MKKLLAKLSRFIDGLSYVTGAVAALCIVAAAVIVTEGVIVRKIFGISAIWQIEASVFLLMYACFVGAAYAQMKERHLNVDLVIIHFSPRKREMIIIVTAVISCLICGIIAWYSWPMWWEALVRNDHSDSLWGPPLWIPYFFLPFGMSVLFLQYVAYISKKIVGLRRLDAHHSGN